MAKAGGRKAKRITVDELKAYFMKYKEEGIDSLDYCIYNALNASKKAMTDLSKVIFDFENWTFKTGEFCVACQLGIIQKDDLVFVLGCAGGDWESPVIFALYLDPKGVLRGYVPEDGNTYDKKYKTAYGSQGENDIPVDEEDEDNCSPDDAPEANESLIIADICRRIQVM
jgi:hypothetical protein